MPHQVSAAGLAEASRGTSFASVAAPPDEGCPTVPAKPEETPVIRLPTSVSLLADTAHAPKNTTIKIVATITPTEVSIATFRRAYVTIASLLYTVCPLLSATVWASSVPILRLRAYPHCHCERSAAIPTPLPRRFVDAGSTSSRLPSRYAPRNDGLNRSRVDGVGIVTTGLAAGPLSSLPPEKRQDADGISTPYSARLCWNT